MAKNLTATLTKPAAATGSVTAPAKRGRKEKPAGERTIRVPLQKRDIDRMIALLDTTMTAKPVEPVEPTITDDMTAGAVAAAYREYADAVRNFPRSLDSWENENLGTLRIRNNLNAALLGIPLRVRAARHEADNK